MMLMPFLFLFSLLFVGPAPVSFAAPAAPPSLSMTDAVKRSLEKNLDLRISSAATDEKAGALTRASGDFDVILSSSYTLDDDRTPSSSNLDGVDASSFLLTRTRTFSLTLKKKFSLGTEIQLPYSYPQTASNSSYQRIPLTHSPSFTLKATQPLTPFFLFSPGYFEKKLTEARLDSSIASKKHDDKIDATVMKTIELFLDTLKEREAARIKKSSYDLAKETLNFVKEKHRAGRSSLIDLLEAESGFKKNEEAWLSAQATFQNKKEELALHALADPGENLELENPLQKALNSPSAAKLEEQITGALKARPEALSSRESVEKAEITLRAASIDRYPKLNIKGDVTLSALNRDFSTSHQEIKDRKFQSWSAEVSLEQPLLMRAARGALQIAEFKLKQEELKKLQTERNISLEIRKNLRQLQNNWERIQAYEKVVEAEAEKFKGEEARFKAGKISVYNFNLAASSEQSARLDLLKSKMDFLKTQYKLAESRGILLEELGLQKR